MSYRNQGERPGQDAAWTGPEFSDDRQSRGATVDRLRARAAWCVKLANQATSLGVATEFEILAREYESDAASLEAATMRR